MRIFGPGTHVFSNHQSPSLPHTQTLVDRRCETRSQLSSSSRRYEPAFLLQLHATTAVASGGSQHPNPTPSRKDSESRCGAASRHIPRLSGGVYACGKTPRGNGVPSERFQEMLELCCPYRV